MKNRFTQEEIAKCVDELIEAAKHVQSCEDTLNHTDGYVLQNQRALDMARRELCELREQFLSTYSTKAE
jgi:hypothetical protein